jgi:hypothetical protein
MDNVWSLCTCETALLLQKGQDIAVELLCPLDDHEMTGVGIEQKPDSWDVLCSNSPWIMCSSTCSPALAISGTLFSVAVIKAPDVSQRSAAQCGTLYIPEHGMRLIGFFQVANFIRSELDREGCDSIIQVMRLGCADNRSCDDRFGEDPG